MMVSSHKHVSSAVRVINWVSDGHQADETNIQEQLTGPCTHSLQLKRKP